MSQKLESLPPTSARPPAPPAPPAKKPLELHVRIDQPPRHTTDLYFECHVTIEPVFDERLTKFQEICRDCHFKAADLLMKKRAGDTAERSEHDTFATGRAKEYDVIVERMGRLLQRLWLEGFQVWRYKIENTLIDVKMGAH
jgi:hypothetical protein